MIKLSNHFFSNYLVNTRLFHSRKRGLKAVFQNCNLKKSFVKVLIHLAYIFSLVIYQYKISKARNFTLNLETGINQLNRAEVGDMVTVDLLRVPNEN